MYLSTTVLDTACALLSRRCPCMSSYNRDLGLITDGNDIHASARFNANPNPNLNRNPIPNPNPTLNLTLTNLDELLQQLEEDTGLSVGAAWIAGQDRSMWRTLRPSAGQAQQ